MGAKKVTTRIMAMGLGLVLSLAAAEIGLRLVGFEFQLYPTKVQFGWPDPGSMQRLYRVHPTKLWVPKDYGERVAQAVQESPRHVYMGCSCTQFGRYDEAFAAALEASHPDATYSYVNLGVGGWSTHQGLQQMREDVLRIKPQLATIYYGWNDHWATFGIEDKEIASYNLEHPRVLTWLTEHSRVAQAINRVLFEDRFDGLSHRARVSLEDFKGNLSAMVALARENGITPVLLTAPSSHKEGDEPVYVTLRWLKNKADLVPLHRAYVEAVRDVAAEEKVHLVDLFAAFADLEPAAQEASFQEDGVHLTPEGNVRIAKMLHGSLARVGLLDALAR